MIDISKIEAGKHYVCQLYNDEIVMICYHGDNIFSCGVKLDDVKTIHRCVENPANILSPDLFYANIANLSLYKRIMGIIQNQMLEGKKKIAYSAKVKDEQDLMISDDMARQILKDLKSAGWNAFYKREEIYKGYPMKLTYITFEFIWQSAKISWFDSIGYTLTTRDV